MLVCRSLMGLIVLLVDLVQAVFFLLLFQLDKFKKSISLKLVPSDDLFFRKLSLTILALVSSVLLIQIMLRSLID